MKEEEKDELFKELDLLEHEARCVAGVSDAKRQAAADFLAKDFSEQVTTTLRRLIIKGKDRFWFSDYHFHTGMQIRNILRTNGFGEDGLGIENLDFIYCKIMERAIMGQEVNWEEKNKADNETEAA